MHNYKKIKTLIEFDEVLKHYQINDPFNGDFSGILSKFNSVLFITEDKPIGFAYGWGGNIEIISVAGLNITKKFNRMIISEVVLYLNQIELDF